MHVPPSSRCLIPPPPPPFIPHTCMPRLPHGRSHPILGLTKRQVWWTHRLGYRDALALLLYALPTTYPAPNSALGKKERKCRLQPPYWQQHSNYNRLEYNILVYNSLVIPPQWTGTLHRRVPPPPSLHRPDRGPGSRATSAPTKNPPAACASAAAPTALHPPTPMSSQPHQGTGAIQCVHHRLLRVQA
jgi:hypothetical protein